MPTVANTPASSLPPVPPDWRRTSLSEAELARLEPVVALDTVLLLLAGTALGAIIAAVVLPDLLPDLIASLLGDQPKVFWYLSRSSGIVAYLLLWLSAVLGLSMTNRLARMWPGGPAAADLHQFVSLLALVLITFHVTILLGDRFANYRIDELLVPFTATEDAPFWVGLGQVALYLSLPVTFSFYVRQTIGVHTWRLIHYTSFAILILVIAHGLGAGTDARTSPIEAMYLVTASALVFLTTYRILIRFGRHGRNPAVRSA
jgi:predicted ferric reductase